MTFLGLIYIDIQAIFCDNRFMKTYRVIHFSDVGEPSDEEKQINEMSYKGYKLISVSGGRAYFESVKNAIMEDFGL